jgi:hypothetical protein
LYCSSPEDNEATTTCTKANDNTTLAEEDTSSGSKDNVLAELRELEEVDMNDENLDMLEWMTRKLISIPKTYYWDHPSETNPEQLPTKLKLWHRSVAGMGSAVRFTDRIGAPIVDALGLTASRFDHVTSTMTERDWEYSRQIVKERRRLQREDPSELGAVVPTENQDKAVDGGDLESRAPSDC